MARIVKALAITDGPLLGLDLPVCDRELDWYFGEGEDDFVAVYFKYTIFGFELLLAVGGRKDGPWPFFAIVKNVGLGVHPLEVEKKVGDCRAHVSVADFAERRSVLFDGDEVVGVGDKVGVVPLLRRLLLDGRRARWGSWSLAFALLRRRGVEWGEFVYYLVCGVGQRRRAVCCLSLALNKSV
eukprot:scaffold2651_cov118-Isochrysis_galbana.AAC.4